MRATREATADPIVPNPTIATVHIPTARPESSESRPGPGPLPDCTPCTDRHTTSIFDLRLGVRGAIRHTAGSTGHHRLLRSATYSGRTFAPLLETPQCALVALSRNKPWDGRKSGSHRDRQAPECHTQAMYCLCAREYFSAPTATISKSHPCRRIGKAAPHPGAGPCWFARQTRLGPRQEEPSCGVQSGSKHRGWSCAINLPLTGILRSTKNTPRRSPHSLLLVCSTHVLMPAFSR